MTCLIPAPRGGTARLLLAGLLLATLSLGACKSLRHKEDMNASAESLYKRATTQLQDGNYPASVKTYEALTARFPFSDSARQARLDLIYAYYKEHEKDSAIDAADTFIRENPTHPRIDYAYYMKGLVHFERSRNFMERWFSVDLAQRPPQDARKSFDAFSRVVSQYPNSEYAPDARQRMIFLRNRLAEYEIHVARYYVRRGAWVAAAARARYVVETYDGSPSAHAALSIMVDCYHRLGLVDLEADARKVLAANPQAAGTPTSVADRKHHWYQFWRQ